MEDCDSVVKSVRPRTLLATLSVLTLIGATLVGSNAASADSVQTQSYQRASQTEACVTQVAETPWQANWGTDSSWKPTWEQWANQGTGGWTCTRSITWARDSTARTYAMGDIGPGGGMVFLISGDLTYEMAPNTWSAGGFNEKTRIQWCSDQSNFVTTSTAVGTGSANTIVMLTSAWPFVACTSSAPNTVRAYAGGGLTDWFLPSQDELNAMCNFSRNPTAPAAPSVSCYGSGGTTQKSSFAAGTYGFASDFYWSSSQADLSIAWAQGLDNGHESDVVEKIALRVRPVRAF